MAKRALLVGINAYPTAPLRGCVNDVNEAAQLLVDRCGFKEQEIRLVVDGRATTAAIVERLEWLVRDAKAGDQLVFYYSGHGAQMATRSGGGEVDGLDEVICPVDFDWTEERVIRDKQFNRIFGSRNVPAGVEFVWLSDSCHSGDLERDFFASPGVPKRLLPPPDLAWRARTARARGLQAASLCGEHEGVNVALISGCASDQTSADAVFGGRPNGALSHFLLRRLEAAENPPRNLRELVSSVGRDLSAAGFSQRPHLCGSSALMDRPFLGLTSWTGAAGRVSVSVPALGEGRDVLMTVIQTLPAMIDAISKQTRQARSVGNQRPFGVDDAIIAAATTVLPAVINAAKSQVPRGAANGSSQRLFGVDDAIIAAAITALPAVINAAKSQVPRGTVNGSDQRLFGVDDAIVAAAITALPAVINAVKTQSWQIPYLTVPGHLPMDAS